MRSLVLAATVLVLTLIVGGIKVAESESMKKKSQEIYLTTPTPSVTPARKSKAMTAKVIKLKKSEDFR